MPGDLIISDASLHAAPKETPVPASTRYIVKQVQALYTDNGAGGAWLPALEIVSDAGIVTGRYVGESVAAGSGQEVTWFPLGSKGATAASTDQPFAVCRRAGFNVPVVAGGGGANWHPFDSITTSGSTFDLDGNGRPQINEAGFYYFTGTLQLFDTTWTAPIYMDVDLSLVTGGGSNQFIVTAPGIYFGFPGWIDSAGTYTTQLSLSTYVNIDTPPEQFRWRVFNISGAGLHVATDTFAAVTMQRLGDPTTGGL